MKTKNPDALIALSYPADSFLITAQAKEVGLNPKFMYELVGPAIAFYRQKFGQATEGISTMGRWSPKTSFTSPAGG
jgi:branched-chain amino acid transport system substrate-binding protein